MAMPTLVLVLGKIGVGKSTFVKTATGLDSVEIGQSLEPCMQSRRHIAKDCS